MTRSARRISQRPWRLRRILTGILAASVLVSLFAFPHAGQFLVVDDRVAHAEVALILSGDPIRRALAARDLYREGRIDRIVIIPEPPDPAEGELVKFGLLDPRLPPWSERILVASGVPRATIQYLPEPTNGTIAEALKARRYFAGQFPKRLVVVTATFSSRRARFIFRRVFHDLPVEIACSPSPYDTFQPQRWWQQPRNALTVVTEYQKLLANALTLAVGGLNE